MLKRYCLLDDVFLTVHTGGIMLSRFARFLLMAVFLLMLQQGAFAQYSMWGDGTDIAVRQGAHISYYGAAAQDNNGNICVLWSDARNGTRGLFAQVFNENGEAQWGENGIPVSIGTGFDFYHHLISLEDGSWIALSLECRQYADSEFGNLYVQRIDASGESMWQDGGVLVNGPSQATNAVEILPSLNDGTLDGILISWLSSERDIYAQRLSLTGELQWGNEGVLCAEATYLNTRRGYSVCQAADGGFLLSWVKRRESVNYLQMQKVSSEGNLLWADGDEDPSPEGKTITVASSYSNPQLIADGNNGGFVIWNKQRFEEYGTDIMAQHVDASSNFLWGENHAVICDFDSWKDYLSVIPSESGGIVVWSDERNPSSDYDIYMQKFTVSDGEMELHWGELDAMTDGEMLCSGNLSQDQIELVTDNNGGFIACWTEFEIEYSIHSPLLAQHFNASGEPQWECGEAYGISTGRTRRQYYWGSTSWYNNHNIFARQSGASVIRFDLDINDEELLLQNITSTGEMVFPDGGTSLVSGVCYSAQDMQVLVNDYNVYIAWLDQRGRDRYYYTPYLQQLNIHTGEARFEDNGISLMPAYPIVTDEDTVYANVSDLNFIADEMGGVIASWTRYINGETRHMDVIYAQRVNSDGVTLWNDEGSPVCIAEGMPEHNHRNAHMAADGNGGAFVAFNGVNFDNTYRIALQHMNANGEMLLSDGSFPYRILLANGANNYVRDLTRVNATNYMVLFEPNNSRLVSLFFDSDGEQLADQPVNLNQENAFPEHFVSMRLNDGMLVVWKEYFNSAYDIRGQLLSEDGQRLWEDENGLWFASVNSGGELFDASCYEENADEFWLTWVYDNQLLAQRFNSDGEAQLDEENGVLVYEPDDGEYISKPVITSGRESDAFISWEEGYYPLNERKYIHIDAYGDPFETYTHSDSLLLADSLHYAGDMHMEPYFNGEYAGFIAVWTDDRSWNGREWETVSNVYAQCIMDQYTGATEYVQAPTPSEYVLHSAYPNPFNPSTVIAVGLPAAAELEVKVYNVMGREVTTLANGRYQEGFHAFRFDASGLASGLYFVRATVPGEMHEVQKIMLVK